MNQRIAIALLMSLLMMTGCSYRLPIMSTTNKQDPQTYLKQFTNEAHFLSSLSNLLTHHQVKEASASIEAYIANQTSQLNGEKQTVYKRLALTYGTQRAELIEVSLSKYHKLLVDLDQLLTSSHSEMVTDSEWQSLAMHIQSLNQILSSSPNDKGIGPKLIDALLHPKAFKQKYGVSQMNPLIFNFSGEANYIDHKITSLLIKYS